MPPAAPRPDTHLRPPCEPSTEDLGLHPELLACWALQRAHRGGVTTSGGQYIDHGCLKLSHLTRTFDELTNAGLLAVADADPSGVQRVNLTETGHTYYTQLTTHQVAHSVPEPPSPHQTPAGHRLRLYRFGRRWCEVLSALGTPKTEVPRNHRRDHPSYRATDLGFCGPPGDRTQNLRILGPLLWLVVGSTDHLRFSRLQTLIVCGRLGLSGCV
jgi:hypothetical protein